MNDQSKETLSLSIKPDKPKRVAGRKTRKFKGGENAVTWDYVPQDLIPEGYVAEWKNTHVYGQPVEESQPDYHVFLQDQGWEYATVDQFRPMVGPNWKHNTINRRGQVLMIRPKELSDEARAEDKQKADVQLNGKLQQLGMAEKGQFARKNPVVKRTYERVEVPEE